MELEWMEQNKIKLWVQQGVIEKDTYYSMECEMPVSFLECMPLYKWQYCHELLVKQKGYCDLVFVEFIEELEEHLQCSSRLIKLSCLDEVERKDLIKLFTKILKKSELFLVGADAFLQSVEELKTNKYETRI